MRRAVAEESDGWLTGPLDKALRAQAVGHPAQALAPSLQALAIAEREQGPLSILNALSSIHLELTV